MRRAERIFRQHNFRPLPNKELSTLVQGALEHCTEEELVRFVKASKRFNKGPVTYHEKSLDHPGRKIYWFGMRESLRQFPAFYHAAEKAGITQEQGMDLLTHALTSLRFDFVQEYEDIRALIKAVDAIGDRQLPLQTQLATLKELMSATAQGDIQGAGLYALSISTRMGLSLDQSLQLIRKIPDIERGASGYPFPYFVQALRTLNIATVDPALVVKVFDKLGGESPWMNNFYQEFETAITFGCPDRGITPQELLLKLEHRGMTQLEPSDEQAESAPAQYFIPIEGKLIHAALPYANRRSFHAGHQDLEEMAVARYHRWEEVGEGLWIHDPATETWYSLGGKTEIEAGKVRHVFLPYDAAKLSNEPIITHIHPEELEIMITPHYDDLVIPELRYKLANFLSATPSRADFKVMKELTQNVTAPWLTAHIVHSTGTTEIRYRNDPSLLEMMSEKSRDLRDQVMLEFDAVSYWNRMGDNEAPYSFVRTLVNQYNNILPSGIDISVHPRKNEREE